MICLNKIDSNTIKFKIFAPILMLLIFVSGTLATEKPPSEANKADLIEAGRGIAKKQCLECHAIGKKGKSTHKEAPPFRTFSQKWPVEVLEESLAEGIMTGHNDMPEVQMSPEEITAFIAYLKSLEG